MVRCLGFKHTAEFSKFVDAHSLDSALDFRTDSEGNDADNASSEGSRDAWEPEPLEPLFENSHETALVSVEPRGSGMAGIPEETPSSAGSQLRGAANVAPGLFLGPRNTVGSQYSAISADSMERQAHRPDPAAEVKPQIPALMNRTSDTAPEVPESPARRALDFLGGSGRHSSVVENFYSGSSDYDRSSIYDRSSGYSSGPKVTVDDRIDLNQTGIIPSIVLVSVWVTMASGVLVVFVYVYAYVLASAYARRSEELAVAHVRSHTPEVLAPAVQVADVAGQAMHSGILAGPSDYPAVARLLAPHFAAAGAALLQVELAGPPGAPNGSVIVEPARDGEGGVEMRSDRGDCALIGRHGCSPVPLRMSESPAYHLGFLEEATWLYTPPSEFWVSGFACRDTHEVVSAELCWRPTYAFVKKIEATGPASAFPMLVHATLDSAVLQAVAHRAEQLSRGEVLICNSDGEILAASDMAVPLSVVSPTGTIRMSRVWELDRSWARQVDENFIRNVKPKLSNQVRSWGARITAWRVEDLSNSTPFLEDYLRVVLAVPDDAFLDPLLGPLVSWSLLTGGAPFAVVAALTVIAACFQCYTARRSQSPKRRRGMKT